MSSAPSRAGISVIAASPDAEALAAARERLERTLPGAEVVLVCEGALAERLRRPGCVVVELARRFGREGAIAAGLAVATGDACVILEGLERGVEQGLVLEAIPLVVAKWREGLEVVEAHLRPRFFGRRPVATLLDRKVVTALAALPERDRSLEALAGFLGFRRAAIRVGPGGAVASIPGAGGPPSTGPIFFLASVVTALSGLAILAYAWLALFGPGAPSGFATLLVAVLALGAFQLFGLAVLGDYLGRVLEETKRRPHAVVREVWNAPGASAPS